MFHIEEIEDFHFYIDKNTHLAYGDITLPPVGYAIQELNLWFNMHEFFGILECDTDLELSKAAALEVIRRDKQLIYNDNRLWEVQYVGPHEIEEDSHEITARLLCSSGKDVLVVPNSLVDPDFWVYYISNGTIIP